MRLYYIRLKNNDDFTLCSSTIFTSFVERQECKYDVYHDRQRFFDSIDIKLYFRFVSDSYDRVYALPIAFYIEV